MQLWSLVRISHERLWGEMFPYNREVCGETAYKWSVSLQVVINGGATSSGEQDNEDTELMAIYTTENGIAEKVPTCIAAPRSPPLLSGCCVPHLRFHLCPPVWVWVCVGVFSI